MRYRPFLANFDCSEISLGTLGLSGGYGPFDEVESIRTIKTAVDLGINLIDTADVYGRGLAEELIGKALPTSNDVLVVTKIGRDWYYGNNRKNWDPQYLSFAAHNCLRRLRRPVVDICLLHNPDLETIDRGEAFAAMEQMRKKGDVRHWGVSITTAEEGIAAASDPDIEVIQFYGNIAEPELFHSLLPFLDLSRFGVMVRMPLASGLLTGKYGIDHQFAEDDYRGFRGEVWIRKMIHFGKMEFSGRNLKERVRLAFQYVLMTPGVSTVTCGMRSSQQVKDDISALYE